MHVFTLYVCGIKPSSRRAIGNLRELCLRHMPGKHKISIVDISEHPDAARDDDIVAVPTLVKSWPLPRQVFVGDLSDASAFISRLSVENP